MLVNLKYNKRVLTQNPDGTLKMSTILVTSNPRYFNLKGNNAKNPDELVSYYNSLFAQTMEENKKVKEQYELYLKNTPAAKAVNTQEFFKQKNIKID